MKKIVKSIFIFTPIIVIFLMIIPFIISPISNEISLNNFSKQLKKHPLPQKTEIIEKQQVCGKLNGNGNGMDFFSCILIKSDLSLDELKQYFKAISFKPAKSGKNFLNHIVDIDVVQSKGQRLQTEYVEHGDIYFDSLKNEKDYSKYYIVMIYDGGYPADFDLRGH